MLIKSKHPAPAMGAVLSMEDIDHVISAYELQSAVTSIESLSDEIEHANDIVNSTEQLALVLEGISELSMTDAALVQVIGDIAGASCGVDGSHFTPSMEDAEEGKPLGEKIKAILNQIAAFIRKIFAQVKMYIAHQFSKSHRIAKKYEALGEKIRNFNFVNAIEVEMLDMAGGSGGLMGVARKLPELQEALMRCFRGGANIFEAQVNLIEAVETGGLEAYPAAGAKIVEVVQAAAAGYQTPTSLTGGGGRHNVNGPLLLGNSVIEVALIPAEPQVDNVGFHTLFDASIYCVERPDDAAYRKQSKFKLSHQLVKDTFDALRPVVDTLTNNTSADGFLFIMREVDKKGNELDAWLHKQIQMPAESQAHPEEVINFFRVAGSRIAHGQLKKLIHSHHRFQRVLELTMDYIDQCLTKAAPQAVKPEQTAMPEGGQTRREMDEEERRKYPAGRVRDMDAAVGHFR